MLHFIAADLGIWCFFDSGIRDKFFPDPRFNPYILKLSNNFSMVSVTSLPLLRQKKLYLLYRYRCRGSKNGVSYLYRYREAGGKCIGYIVTAAAVLCLVECCSAALRVREYWVWTEVGERSDWSIFRYRFDLPILSDNTIGWCLVPIFVSADCVGSFWVPIL